MISACIAFAQCRVNCMFVFSDNDVCQMRKPRRCVSVTCHMKIVTKQEELHLADHKALRFKCIVFIRHIEN